MKASPRRLPTAKLTKRKEKKVSFLTLLKIKGRETRETRETRRVKRSDKSNGDIGVILAKYTRANQIDKFFGIIK